MKRIYVLTTFLMLSSLGATFGQWLKVEPVSPGSVYSLWSSGDTLFAGGDSLLFYSFDSGNTWGNSSKVPDVEYGINAILPVNGGIYIGTSLKGVYFSSNLGNSWEERSAGLTGLGAKEVSDFAVRDDYVYASTIGGGIYRNSLTNPGEWVLFSDGIPWNTGWTVYCLRNIDGDLYAGGGVNGFYYVNRKNTSNWVEISFDWFNGEANGILAFGKSGSKIVASAHQGVYTSNDSGLTWTKHSFGIGLVESSEISVKGNTIVIALSKAARYYIYYSNDNGVTWWRNDMQSGSLAYSMNISGGKIWAGRLDGLYYKPDTITGIGDDVETPVAFSLSQNYPNPFNPSTKINFSLDAGGQTTLKVYNVIGKEVATLVDGYTKAGNHSVSFKAEDLPSGVYLYKLVTPSGTKTGKMTLLK